MTTESKAGEALDLNKLEALAKAATPGPWRLAEHGWIDGAAPDEYVVQYEGCGSHAAEWDENDLQYVLAAHPAAILELIALVRRSLPVDGDIEKLLEAHANAAIAAHEHGAVGGFYTDLLAAQDAIRAALARAGIAANAGQQESHAAGYYYPDDKTAYLLGPGEKRIPSNALPLYAAPVSAAPQDGPARAALRKLCDQLEGMKHTMFLMPGTGQHYSYWLREDASFFVEQARKFLAEPVSAVPHGSFWQISDAVAAAQRIKEFPGFARLPHAVTSGVNDILFMLARVSAAPAAPTCTNFDAWWDTPNAHTGHPPSAFMDQFSARAAWHAARVIFLAAPTAAEGPSLDAAELARLRRLLNALGMDGEVTSDETVRGMLFTALGQAAGKIERATKEGAGEVGSLKLAHGHREDFYLLANARRIANYPISSIRRMQNWALAMELFATGSNSGYQICRDAGIDPDGYTVERAARPKDTTDTKEKA